MERDKRGRFVKKANTGTTLSNPNLNLPNLNFNFNPTFIPGSTSTFNPSLDNNLELNKHSMYMGLGEGVNPKIKYNLYEDGKYRDQYGREINPYTIFRDQYEWDDNRFVKNESGNLVPTSSSSQKYQRDSNLSPVLISNQNQESENSEQSEDSYGRKIFDDEENQLNKIFSKPIDKGKLADFLTLTGGAFATSVNNKIADRALKSEKPFLQEISESSTPIIGDYRAKLEGEQAAAQLRNSASEPMTSDGALQQQTMLNAQIKGQDFINNGNTQDEIAIKQSMQDFRNLEKENRQNRHAVAMQNKQAMLQTEKAKAQILNERDSANFKQITEPFIQDKIANLREQEAEQKYYDDYYNTSIISNNVWNTEDPNLTPEQRKIQKMYLTQGLSAVQNYLGEDSNKIAEWTQLQKIKQNEIIKQQALRRGVEIDPKLLPSTAYSKYGKFTPQNPIDFNKDGGTINKARLIKQSKDKFNENSNHLKNLSNNVKLITKFKKKLKYQAGGGLPFVGFSPPASQVKSAPSNTTKEKDDKDELTTKDILELLKDLDGLPSDVDAIKQDLSNFIISNNNDPLGLMSSSSIESQYLNIIGKIKKAKANRNWFDKAYDKLRDNDALNEYAISNEGKFIGIHVENGDYKWFTCQDIENGEAEEYQLLTNSNLLDIRARNIDAAFNSTLIQESANGISIDQVVDHINKIIQNLGSDKNSTQLFGDQSKEVLAGLQQLQIAAQQVGQDLSISDLYEANIFTENQANQAASALSYIYSTLPKNMKSLLFIKSGSMEGVDNLIKNLVTSKLSSTTKLEFSPKNKKSESKSKSEKGIDGLDLSPAQMLQRGYGERETIIIQNSTSTGLKIEAVKMPITKNGNDTIGSCTLEDISRSQYGGILDFTNASIGGQIIPFEGRNNVAVDGTKIYSMYLPINQDEFYSTGNIVPDIELIDKLNRVNQIIKEQQITDVAEINAIYEEEGLPTYLTNTGAVIPTSYRRFGVLNGTVINRAFGPNTEMLKDNKFLKEIDNENLINGAIDIMNHGRDSKNKIEFDGGWFGNDVMYQGTIFIPISNDVFAGIAGSGKTITSEEAEDLYEKQQQQQRVNITYNNPGELQ